MEIYTPRLIIRPPTLDDLDAIHTAKMEVWPELQKWMSWAYDEAGTIESTRKFITDYQTVLCAFDRTNGNFVVSTGCDKTSVVDEYATGYWVAANYLGKGFATESTNAILRYAFNALNAKAVHIAYYEGNDKSKRVIEKLGFEFTHVNRKSHVRCSNGELMDECKYVRRNADNLPPLEVTWS